VSYRVDFTTIPADTSATPATKTAAVYNMCRNASGQVNGYVNFPPRSMLNTEYLQGPDYRVTVQNNTGNGRLILQRWPVIQVIGVSVSPNNTFPRQYTALPAGSWDVEVPILGAYGTNTASASGEGGQAILIAPGYITKSLGRWGYRIQVLYIHGWPHTEVQSAASAGVSTLTVGDITGFAPVTAGGFGTNATVYDITGGQESITVTATTPTTGTVAAGPGTLTLSSALAYAHGAGILVSALPADVIWASALYTAADALTRGATATQLRSAAGAGGAPTGAPELRTEAELILNSFKRTV
jgi:hypothetical protein